MVTFYKHHIPDWMDGTDKLDHISYRVYHVVCQLIYLNEGPIANNEQGIAGHCRTSVAGYRRVIKTLLDLGKLTLIDGRLANCRAATELASVVHNRSISATGGLHSAGVAKRRRNAGQLVADKPLKNNDQATAPLFDANSYREEKRREDSKSDSSGLVSPNGETEQEAAITRERVLGNFDFLSDDGSVLILADEFAALENELPSIKSVRALVRHACRSWLLQVNPPERKKALLSWLRKKNAETTQRQSLKRDEVSRRDVFAADRDQRKRADAALAVRARANRRQQAEGNDDVHEQGGPDGEFPPSHPHGSH